MTFKAAKGAFLITEPCVAAQVLEALEASPQDGLRAPPCLSTSLVWGAGSAVSPCKLGSRCLPRWHQPAGSPLGEGQAARGRDRGGFAARRLDQPGGGSFASSFRQTPASEVAGSRAAAGPQRTPDRTVPLGVSLLCRRRSHLSLGIGQQAGGGTPTPRPEGSSWPKKPQFLYL